MNVITGFFRQIRLLCGVLAKLDQHFLGADENCFEVMEVFCMTSIIQNMWHSYTLDSILCLKQKGNSHLYGFECQSTYRHVPDLAHL